MWTQHEIRSDQLGMYGEWYEVKKKLLTFIKTREKWTSMWTRSRNNSNNNTLYTKCHLTLVFTFTYFTLHFYENDNDYRSLIDLTSVVKWNL